MPSAFTTIRPSPVRSIRSPAPKWPSGWPSKGIGAAQERPRAVAPGRFRHPVHRGHRRPRRCRRALRRRLRPGGCRRRQRRPAPSRGRPQHRPPLRRLAPLPAACRHPRARSRRPKSPTIPARIRPLPPNLPPPPPSPSYSPASAPPKAATSKTSRCRITRTTLIAQVAAANPHTIVVLETGGPVTMPWLDHARCRPRSLVSRHSRRPSHRQHPVRQGQSFGQAPRHLPQIRGRPAPSGSARPTEIRRASPPIRNSPARSPLRRPLHRRPEDPATNGSTPKTNSRSSRSASGSPTPRTPTPRSAPPPHPACK